MIIKHISTLIFTVSFEVICKDSLAHNKPITSHYSHLHNTPYQIRVLIRFYLQMSFLSFWTWEQPRGGWKGDASNLHVLNPSTERQVQHTCQQMSWNPRMACNPALSMWILWHQSGWLMMITVNPNLRVWSILAPGMKRVSLSLVRIGLLVRWRNVGPLCRQTNYIRFCPIKKFPFWWRVNAS